MSRPPQVWRSGLSVPATVQLGGKWKGQPLVAAAAGQNNGLLFVTDSVSKQQFLVDMGAEVSVLPATGLDMRSKQPGPPLAICHQWQFYPNLWHPHVLLTWMLAYIRGSSQSQRYPVPCWELIFLHSNSLLVDLCGKQLVDAATYPSVPTKLPISTHLMPHLDALSSSVNRYNKILVDFPDITTPNFIQSQNKHGVEHFIPISGPPVYT